jgi:hypothetical protein
MDTQLTKTTGIQGLVTKNKLLTSGMFILFTIGSGVWLSNAGKPFNTGIFTLHKLIAVATVFFTCVHVYRLYKSLEPRRFFELALVAVTGLAFLALVVTGALLSVNLSLPGFVLTIHQVAPVTALVFAGTSFYHFTARNQ